LHLVLKSIADSLDSNNCKIDVLEGFILSFPCLFFVIYPSLVVSVSGFTKIYSE